MNTAKRMIKKLMVIVIAALSTMASARAQENPLAKEFREYQGKFLQEKLFMHTDKDFYLAGDLLWFKLYYVDAFFHEPLNMSKVAYIEILDKDNKPVVQSKTALGEGNGKGSLFLPVNIPSGNYKIRAYTNWMKNFGADQFFEKKLSIVNAQKKRDAVAQEKKDPAFPDVQLFPEGGNMVYGLNSKMACKVVDQSGKGIEFDGIITDETNRTVANFHSLQFGMCSFDFNPSSNHRYKAEVSVKGQEKIVKPITNILREGYVLSVDGQASDEVTVTVETNLTTAREVFLLVHTRQSVKASENGAVRNGQAVFKISKSELGDGISHFTVFNSDRETVCERLYFKYPVNKLNIGLATDKTVYAARTKVNIDIQAADQAGRPSDADLSMAVYSIDSLQSPDEMDIANYLLLTSDLRGFVESPNYYFSAPEKTAAAAVENLMLTQGWRRFKWVNILPKKMPPFNFKPELNGHIITGKLYKSTTNAPIANTQVYLSVPGMWSAFYPTTSDSEGKIKFEVSKTNGATEIIAQPDAASDTLGRIDINNPFFESYTDTKLPVFGLSAKTANTLRELNLSTQVQNVYASDKLKRFTDHHDTIPFYGKPDAVYFMDDYTRFTTMEEVLREYVGFMDFQKSKSGQVNLSLLDMSTTKTYFSIDPLILVDGVPLANPTKLMSLDPLKFRKLDVVNRRYFLGNTYFNGILNWQSYKGDLANLELDPRATVLDYEGLQLEREFYAPVYDSQEKTDSHFPDFRNVLYWSPDVRVNATGKGSVNFYSSDKKGKYIAVIEGLSKDGKCASKTIAFEVK
jgi:hypothetical protein